MYYAFFRRVRGLVSALLVSLAAGSPCAAQTSVLLHTIMSNLPHSPYLGQTVRTTGVVVGVLTTGGFYLSSPDSEWDNDVSTAEGMPAFPSTVASCNDPSVIAVGNVVTITGIVLNSSVVNAADTPATGINPTSCASNGTATMTRTIDLSSYGALTSFSDALKFAGMPATDTTLVAIAPSGGSSAGGVVTSSGQFWAVLSSGVATNSHVFRSPGIALDEYVPLLAPPGVPTWSGNPARILIDTTTFGGTSPLDITVGQSITCFPGNGITAGPTTGIGLMDYTLGYARLLLFKTTQCSASGTVQPSVSAVADASHFKVGTLDVNAFLGPGSIQSISSALPTALPKAVQVVTSVFGSPDIFALQDVADQTTLQYLADYSNLANNGSTVYSAAVRGTDQINSGFLINTNTVVNAQVTEAGRGATYTTASGTSATLWDHPPLVLTGALNRTGKNYSITVVNVDFATRDNIDNLTFGPDVRARRAAQAAAVSTLVQQYQTSGANVIVAGNFNGYEFSDGYVDVVGVVRGNPAAQGTVALYQPTNTTAPLTDFTTQVPANNRYNVIESGNAAAVEHILASSTVTDPTSAQNALASYVNAVTQPHFTADYKATSANDATTPAGLTPHDGFLVSFAIPPVPTSASLAPDALNFGDVSIGGSKTLSLTMTNTTAFASTVHVSQIALAGTDAADFTQTNTCVSLGMGQSCTVNVTFTPAAKGARTGTLTVFSDSTANSTFTVPLTGNGLDTTATLTPTLVAFGMQVVNTTSAAQVFTWTNTSSIPLAISGVDTTGDYSVGATTCVGTVAANTACTVSVVFTPVALRTRTGTLTITSASSVNGTLTASLTGVGIANVESSADVLNFGTVDVSASSPAQTITITNYTNAAVALTGITVTGDYSQTNSCGATLAGLASCTIALVFTPTTTGVRTGSLSVTTSDTQSPALTAVLTGNGVDFAVAVSPASGNVIAGLSVSPATNVTPLGGFRGSITMGCTTAALGTACAYKQGTFTLSAATADALTITTTSKYTVVGYGELLLAPGRRGLLVVLLGVSSAAALFAGRRRTTCKPRLLVAFLALGLLTATLSGCSGKYPDLNSPYTAPGVYTIQVTATDGIITRAAAFTLTVTAK